MPQDSSPSLRRANAIAYARGMLPIVGALPHSHYRDADRGVQTAPLAAADRRISWRSLGNDCMCGVAERIHRRDTAPELLGISKGNRDAQPLATEKSGAWAHFARSGRPIWDTVSAVAETLHLPMQRLRSETSAAFCLTWRFPIDI
jgi:hypothetical protein